MSIDAIKYPELGKMQAVEDQSQAIGEFIEWLGENGMAVCTGNAGSRGEAFYPVAVSIEELLAKHFGIDLKAVERERRAVLAAFQSAS